MDGVDLGRGAAIGEVETYRVDERYPTRGVHSEAVNRCNGVRVAARHAESGLAYTIEARAFDDGVAFRIIVPGARAAAGRRRGDRRSGSSPAARSGTTTSTAITKASTRRRRAADLKAGEWAAPPLTIKLPDGRGYAAITEAALGGFAGMALQADGQPRASPRGSGTPTRRPTLSR